MFDKESVRACADWLEAHFADHPDKEDILKRGYPLDVVLLRWIEETGANARRKLLGQKASILSTALHEFAIEVQNYMRLQIQRRYWQGTVRAEVKAGWSVGYGCFNTVYPLEDYLPENASESFCKGAIAGWNRKACAMN